MGGKSHLAGPLCYNVFRRVNTLQLHAPFDETCQRLAGTRASSHRIGRKYEKHLTRLRQALNILVGVFIGVVGALMRYCQEHIWEFRNGRVLSLLDPKDGTCIGLRILRAGVAAAAMTATLGLCASLLVAWRPAAASSGIPGVVAFLNGCDLRSSLTRSLFVAKVAGTVLSVAAGLALGPEGPMIHIGALVGTLTATSFMRPLLRLTKKGRDYDDELSRQPLRYDIQAAAMGAGAGIAAAFNAPLAGTLFVIEEAASFFSKKLFLHTFITCGCAYLSAWGVKEVLSMPEESFYMRTNCMRTLDFDPLLMVQLVSVSLVCSVLAVLFNRTIVWVQMRLVLEQQQLGMGRKLITRRFLIVVLVGALCGTFNVCFPAMRPCKPATLQMVFKGTSGCIPDEWLLQLIAGSKPVYGEDKLEPSYIPAPGLFGVMYDPLKCREACRNNTACCVHGIEKYLPPKMKGQEGDYCCSFQDLEAVAQGRFFDKNQPKAPLNMSTEQWPTNLCGGPVPNTDTSGVKIDQYSPAAALTLVAPSAVLRNLLVRGSPSVLPAPDLAIYFFGYGTLVVASAAAWVPGGLLVPTMILGAASGRLCGLAWCHAMNSFALIRGVPIKWIPEVAPILDFLYPEDQETATPPEPGVLAMAGCAAFLSGSGGLALFVLVLLVEITLEPYMIPVIIVAVMVARTVTSLMGAHGLYHELLNVQSLPFLPERAHWRQADYVVDDLLEEDARRAGQTDETGEPVGRPPLVSVPRDATRERVEQALQTCLPGDTEPMVHGFPVTDQDGRLCGLVTRDALQQLLDHTNPHMSSVPGSPDFASRSSAAAAAADVLLSGVSQLPVRPSGIGVARVMDAAPFVVQRTTPVVQAHMLFSRCGLRHVVVVDGEHRPYGVLTRKSLMPWRTPWVEQSVEHHDTFIETRFAHSPRHSNSPTTTPPPSRRSSFFPRVLRIEARGSSLSPTSPTSARISVT